MAKKYKIGSDVNISTSYYQMLIFQVYIIINNLYIKHSSQFCIFFTFVTTLSSLGIFYYFWFEWE